MRALPSPPEVAPGALRAAPLGLLLALLAACGAEPAATPPAPSPGADAGVSAPSDAGLPGADAGGGSSPSLAAIELSLDAPAELRPGRTATVTATGVLTDGSTLALSRVASFHSATPTVARVLAGGQLVAEAPGVTEVWASRGAVESARLRVEVVAPDTGELRAVWVTRWTYSSVADLTRVVDDVQSANLNAIFFQVRGNGDAYYRSSHEPWASRLSGTLGQDPGWDPLGELIALAHARNIQVHAWLNTFPAWSGTTPPSPTAQPAHPLAAHPDWLCADEAGTPMAAGGEGYQFFSPGNPEVRAHIAAVAEELLTAYALDGIHFDYVRYPGRRYCHDAASEAQFAEARTTRPDLAWEDFQRERVTLLLRDVRGRLERVRPSAVLSVANWGIHKNEFGWSGVSRGFDDYYQDAHRWAREGIVDALCPMTYWRLTDPKGGRTDFATLADDHVGAARDGGRFAFMGISSEHPADELVRQVETARAAGARGVVFFELSALRPKLAELVAGPFAQPVPPPRMSWK